MRVFKFILVLALSFCMLLSLSTLNVCAEKKYEGVELSVVSTVGPFTSGPIKDHAPEWTKMTGGKVKLIEIPFGELFEKIMSSFVTEVGAFDIVHYSAAYMGDIAGGGYVIPLDDYIAGDKRIAWDDILPAYGKRIAVWDNKTYGIPFDGDNHILYYRSDAFNNVEYKEKFKTKYGYNLEPPKTWEEYEDMATFFNGWDWDNDGKVNYGTLEYMARNAQTFWAYFSRTAPYVCLPPDHEGYAPGGLFFDAETMKPYINSPGHIKSLENFIRMVKLGPPDMLGYAASEVRGGFVAGAGALALDWGDIGTMAENPDISRIMGKIGYSILPGTKEVWSHKLQEWVKTPEVNHAPFLAFGGWVFSITKNSKNADAAYDFLSYLTSPEISIQDAATGLTGVNPYRYSHFENVDAWKKYWSDDPKPYLDTIKATIGHPNVQLDLRIPGAFRYFDALDINLSRALSREISAEQALNNVYAEWEKITDELGREKQLNYYRASLGLPQK
jgi:multiple sugar transport system substrate-binding protein